MSEVFTVRPPEVVAAYQLHEEVVRLSHIFNKVYPNFRIKLGVHEPQDLFDDLLRKMGIDPVEGQKAKQLVEATERAELIDFMARKAAKA